MSSLPTPDRLRELLNYDPETGEFRWKIGRKKAAAGTIAGYVRPDGYLFICVDYTKFGAHRAAWAIMTGEWCNEVIDHANMNKLDNRWCNLRKASKIFNAHNTVECKNNTSGYKCVVWNKQRQKWMATTQIRGVRHYIGLFDDKEDAANAYIAFAKSQVGEFARNKND